MKASTKQTVLLWACALLFALLLSVDYDHLLDKALGETVEGEPVSAIDYRYDYGNRGEDVSSIA